MTLKYLTPARSRCAAGHWGALALALASGLAHAQAQPPTPAPAGNRPQLLEPLPTVQPRLITPIQPQPAMLPQRPLPAPMPAQAPAPAPVPAPSTTLPSRPELATAASGLPQATALPGAAALPAHTQPVPTPQLVAQPLPLQALPVPAPSAQAPLAQTPPPAAAAAPTSTEEVPFVTTPDKVTLAMLRLAGVTKRDHVIDLGSGDGRIVIAAAKRFGATGLGVEIDPSLVERSRRHARQAGVEQRAEFREQDLFKTDLRPASVVTMYLLPEVNLQLRPSLLALKPGTRVVSHDWDMGHWPPDRSMTLAVPDKAIGREKTSRVFLWVVPARVGGLWCGKGGQQMQLTQIYQRVQAQVQVPGEPGAPKRRSRQRDPAVDGDSNPGAGSLTSTLMLGQLNGAEMLMTNSALASVGAMRLKVDGQTMKVEDARGMWAKWQKQVLRRADGEQCPAGA